MRSSKNLLIACSILMAMFALSVSAQQKPKPPENPLVGNWQSEEGIKVQIRENGTLTINGEEFAYKVKKAVITIVGEEGAAAMPFVLDGDTLTVEFEGREIVYERVKAGAKNTAAKTNTGEGIIQAFVGKWCYLASMTGNNSYSSSRCFILNANGTYTYSSESSTSGAYGGTNSQSSDSGRWTATRTTLTAYSNTNGKIVYPIELRNHPKNGDPMIIVDGDAYITSYQKPSW